MAAWYLAPSLHVGLSEVDQRWPSRDRTSDGTIGDEAHQSRQSDHNPNTRGAVDAWDMDVNGPDVGEVKRAFERHPSAHYWIHNRQMADADNDWRPTQYSGDNPHTSHVHFSIRQSANAENDRRPWGLLSTEEETMTPAEFCTLLDDPNVAARMQAFPWQYDGGRTQRELSTLGMFDKMYAGSSPGHIAIIDAIAEIDGFDPVEFVHALTQSSEAMAALTSAIAAQIPNVPTAAEIARAFIDTISGNVHNRAS